MREVTRDDVLVQVKTLDGHERHQTLVALRSLFGWAKKNGIVFRNPPPASRPVRSSTPSCSPAALQPCSLSR
ncbi:hypothetical protein ACWC0A_23360 [Streptomyces scopuliridis]